MWFHLILTMTLRYQQREYLFMFILGGKKLLSWVHTDGAGLLCSVAQSCPVSLWPHWLQHARFPCPSLSQSIFRLMCIELAMPSNHIILCHPLFLLLLIFPSICVFSNESALGIRWPKYWSFCFSTSPSNEYSWLISFRIDWFDLLAVQGTLKSLLQHHS